MKHFNNINKQLNNVPIQTNNMTNNFHNSPIYSTDSPNCENDWRQSVQ